MINVHSWHTLLKNTHHFAVLAIRIRTDHVKSLTIIRAAVFKTALNGWGCIEKVLTLDHFIHSYIYSNLK